MGRRSVPIALGLLALLMIGGEPGAAAPRPFICPAPNPACNCVDWPAAGREFRSVLGIPGPTAELCLRNDGTASDVVAELCTSPGEPPAVGSELCALQVGVFVQGGNSFASFSASTSPVVGIQAEVTSSNPSLPLLADVLKVNWLGDPEYIPADSVIHLGTLTLGALLSEPGTIVEVGASSLAIDADLSTISVAAGPIWVPEPSAPILWAASLLLLALLGWRRRSGQLGGLILLLALVAPPGNAQIVGAIETLVNDDLSLENFSTLGNFIAGLGDVDGDGVEDLAVGHPYTDLGKGGLQIVFLRPDGSVKGVQRIQDGVGGLPPGSLNEDGTFGSAIAVLGDLDGAGASLLTLAVAAPGDGLTGSVKLILISPGSVPGQPVQVDGVVTIASPEPVYALANLGDLDGNGFSDLALGHPDSGTPLGCGFSCGAVTILRLGLGGAVVGTHVGLTGPAADDRFGAALAGLGDVDGDSFPDLAIGRPGLDAGAGGVTIAFLDFTGGVFGVTGSSLIDATALPAGINLQPQDGFGSSLADMGDLDGNGIRDLAVGAPGRAGLFAGQTYSGAAAVVTLTSGASPLHVGFLDALAGEVPNAYAGGTGFGISLGTLDVDGDASRELFVGAYTDDPPTSSGIVWQLSLSDPDDDGVPDQLGDNCANLYNPSQTDTDGDGVGDVCDNCRSVANGPGDGVCTQGNTLAMRGAACTADTQCGIGGFCSINQHDTDGDGIGDACEPVVVHLQELVSSSAGTTYWRLAVDCGAHNLTDLSVAIFQPDLSETLDFDLGGDFLGAPGCEDPVPVFGGGGCLGVANLGGNVSNDSGQFTTNANGEHVGGLITGLRPNTLHAWLFGNLGPTNRLCSYGDQDELLALLFYNGLAAAPVGISFAASEQGPFVAFGGAFVEETGAVPEAQCCMIDEGDPDPGPALLMSSGAPVNRAHSVLPPKIIVDISAKADVNPGYQAWEICFKSDEYIRRLKLSIEPPNAWARTTVTWAGCDVSDGLDGYACTEIGVEPYPIRHDTSGVDLPDPLSPPDDGRGKRLYVRLEGNRPGFADDTGNARLNSTIGVADFDDLYHCVGEVQVEGGKKELTDAPIVYIRDETYLDAMVANQLDVNAQSPIDPVEDVALGFAYPPTQQTGCTVPDDDDQDGVRTEADNCPHFANPFQFDGGELKTGTPLGIDGIGDACQCGEGDGDGIISEVGLGNGQDLQKLRNYLLGLPPEQNAYFSKKRCNVGDEPGKPAGCNILDALLLKKALQPSNTLAEPQKCEAANPPAIPL